MTSPQRLLSIAQDDLGDGYSDFRELADGSNSLVCSAVRRADVKEVAVKIIDCRFLLEDSMEVLRLQRELVSLSYFKDTKTPAVIELYSSYYNSHDEVLYIVTEKMDFSLDHLLDVRPLSADEAKIVLYEMCLITAFEHQCAWAHRDRKPDNLLFSIKGGLLPAMKHLGIIQNLDDPITNKEKEEFLKRFRLTDIPCSFKDCDLGLSRYVGKPATSADTPHALLRQLSSQKLSAEAAPPPFLRRCSVLVNTPSYRPWEIVAKEVDHIQFANLAPLPIDMWANGVILVEMLLGEHVFSTGKSGAESESTTELKALLQALPLSDAEKNLLSTECFQKRSSGQDVLRRANCAHSLYDKLHKKGCDAQALSLVRGLLAVDPNARLTALQVLEHPWLTSVRQPLVEKQLFSTVLGTPKFDQDQFGKLALSSQVKKLKATIERVFSPDRRLTTTFFKEEAKRKEWSLSADSPQKNTFRRFKVGQKLWAKDTDKDTWEKVELEEQCAAGGWNVKFPSHEQLFYLPSSALHIARPPTSPKKSSSTSSTSSSSSCSSPSSSSPTDNPISLTTPTKRKSTASTSSTKKVNKKLKVPIEDTTKTASTPTTSRNQKKKTSPKTPADPKKSAAPRSHKKKTPQKKASKKAETTHKQNSSQQKTLTPSRSNKRKLPSLKKAPVPPRSHKKKTSVKSPGNPSPHKKTTLAKVPSLKKPTTPRSNKKKTPAKTLKKAAAKKSTPDLKKATSISRSQKKLPAKAPQKATAPQKKTNSRKK